MSSTPIPIPAGATVGFDEPSQSQTTPQPQPTGEGIPIPAGATVGFDEPSPAPTTPTPAQIKYKQDTAAGPFTKPGAAEAATDTQSPEAIRNMAIGAGATLAVPIAAPLVAVVMAGEVPAILKEISRQALEYTNGKAEVANKALSQFANAYPELSKLVGKLGFGKTAGTLGTGYAAWELFRHVTGMGGK